MRDDIIEIICEINPLWDPDDEDMSIAEFLESKQLMELIVTLEDKYDIDLLFYNIRLRCYVVIELKIGDFKPEYAGQLSFYLTAVDETLKGHFDNPTIGLLLCSHKNNIIAEYTLRDMDKPMGVSEYKITDYLPEELKEGLPTIKDLVSSIEKQID